MELPDNPNATMEASRPEAAEKKTLVARPLASRGDEIGVATPCRPLSAPEVAPGLNEQEWTVEFLCALTDKYSLHDKMLRVIVSAHNASTATLRARAEEAEALLAGYRISEEFRKRLGINTLDAKWLDPRCHKGCQSLVLENETKALRARIKEL